jgi:hypothetical protein
VISRTQTQCEELIRTSNDPSSIVLSCNTQSSIVFNFAHVLGSSNAPGSLQPHDDVLGYG